MGAVPVFLCGKMFVVHVLGRRKGLKDQRKNNSLFDERKDIKGTEIKELFSQIKNMLLANMEIGMEPPPLSSGVMAYLNNGVMETDTDSSISSPVTLEILEQQVKECTKCKLHKTRKNPVFGEGNSNARLVFIGEAPGATEDMQGRPFVGRAGELLTKIIGAMGMSRQDVYICNVVKCRPPGNRDPENDEINACIPYLRQQIGLISPEVICILGRISGQTLLGKDFRITRDRGKWFTYMGIPVMPTFHPAYLLRYPAKKKETWLDVQDIMKRLDKTVL